MLCSVSIAQLTFNGLLILVLIKLTGLLLAGILVLRLGAWRKILAFWRDYWDWVYVKDNVLNLSVWFVTVAGYVYCYHLLHGVGRHAFSSALRVHPWASLYVVGSLVWLVLSTGLQTLSTVRRTAELCERIGHPSAMKNFGRAVMFVSLLCLELSGWPLVLGGVLALVVPGLLVTRVTKRTVGVAVEQFLVLAIAEYAFRVTIVVTAFYVETGTVRLW
jgi:hypothetical protein